MGWLLLLYSEEPTTSYGLLNIKDFQRGVIKYVWTHVNPSEVVYDETEILSIYCIWWDLIIEHNYMILWITRMFVHKIIYLNQLYIWVKYSFNKWLWMLKMKFLVCWNIRCHYIFNKNVCNHFIDSQIKHHKEIWQNSTKMCMYRE